MVDAVGADTDVYVDGGIRSGADVMRALALGAHAVFVGRPVLWGLAVDGADGVRGVLEAFASELKRALAFRGVANLEAVTRDLLTASM